MVYDGGRTDQLVDWLPELGTREPGQEAGASPDHAELPGTTLEAVETGVLSPPLPAHAETTQVDPLSPSALCTPLTFQGVPASLGGPTAPSGGGSRIHTSWLSTHLSA